MCTNKFSLKLAQCFSILAGLLFSTGSVFAEPQLNKLNVNSLMSGKIELEMHFSESISRYSDKLHYRPNQLVIDVQGASSVLKLNPVPVEMGGVEMVKAERTADGLKIIVELKQLMPYRLQHEGNKLLVRFGDVASSRSKTKSTASEAALVAAVAATKPVAKTEPTKLQAPEKPPVKATEVAKAAAVKPAVVEKQPAATLLTQSLAPDTSTPHGFVNSIKSIDFKRGENGSGKLLVYLDNSSVAVDIRRRDNKLLAEFQSTFIIDDLLYVMDVLDFATPVKTIETFKDKGKTRFELDINGAFEYRYDQMDNLFVIDVKEKPKGAKKSVYEGKAISLNFQDIPIRTVLQLIADFNGFNLVTTDSVGGNITLRLDDVPWEQALDIILKVKGLGKRMDGNVLMIAPASELAAKERELLETQQQVAELAPLYSEFLQINYAKAADIAKMLSGSDASLLSSRGSVSIDERTNTLLVKDTTKVLDSVKRMIEVLDIPVKQVLIEARMVTVKDSVGEELGVRWGLTNATTNGGTNSSTSGSLEGVDSANKGTLPSLNDRLNVNLPVADAAGTIAFQVAKLANGQILDLELSALEKENKGEIIASPRITTANQKTAYIEQGTEIPYVEAASSGATSVSFKKAVLSLKVTPHITPDNKVILDLVITQDSKGDTVPTSTGTAVAINTQEIGTQVLVDNGETIVLGGIYQQAVDNTVKKVPVLGDIPGLGIMFRQTIQSNVKQELMIFVTPKIVMESTY